MLEFLNRPYPFSFQPSRRMKQIVPIGLCMFLFLILFRPFGLGNNPDFILFSAFMVTSGAFAGLVTTVLIPLIFPGYFNEDKWTLKKNLFWVVCINFIFVNILFFAFNMFLIFKYNNFQELSFKNYLWWAYLQLLIGIPLGVIINLVNQYYLLKKHIKIAQNINKSFDKSEIEKQPNNLFNSKEIPLGSEKQNNTPLLESNVLEFEIDKFNKVQFGVNNIIYVEALGNYINIAYNINGNKKVTIRETISNIEQKTGTTEFIYKPHRSFLVNLKCVKRITGDSKGLQIHLINVDKVIPVSRNKIKEFRKLISDKL